MERFRYVGGKVKERIALQGVRVQTPAERFEQEVQVFRRVYRDGVARAIMNDGGWFRRSKYTELASQHGAFDRLLEVIKHYDYTLVEVRPCAHCWRDEYLCEAVVRIPTLPQFNDQLFTGGVPEGQRGYVLVGFTFGVTGKFTELFKATEGLEELEHYANLREFEDESFDPDRVISGVLKHMRAEKRYSYLGLVKPILNHTHYQTPEGFIYDIQIQGYATGPV